METNDRLRGRIELFAAELQQEFGPVSPESHGCLMDAVEDWAVQVGDRLARTVMSKQLTQEAPSAEECHCPKCHEPGRWKGERKRRIETRRGPIHVAEPEYYCNRCRRSFFPDDPRIGDGA